MFSTCHSLGKKRRSRQFNSTISTFIAPITWRDGAQKICRYTRLNWDELSKLTPDAATAASIPIPSINRLFLKAQT
jgi:hypothetical protein